MSSAELLLAAQLDQAGIQYAREFQFNLKRRWRADFIIYRGHGGLLVEIEGGTWTQGRHTRGVGFERDCEKYSAAAIAGYRVIRATTEQVEDGRCLEWIREATR